jgi:ABC-2 type transport system permease protein/capsular polysaccharide transport system permease protein
MSGAGLTVDKGLAHSWAVQRRVVGALLMREILTRFGRHNIGFLWLFVEPMTFTLGVTTLWTMTGMNHGSAMPIVPFAITGYSSVLLWRNMPNRCILAVTPNLALMYHRNVRVIDIYFARVLLEGAGATISFTILTLIFSFIGWCKLPEDILQLIGGWLMIAWFGASLAILLGALSEQYELIEKLWHPSAYLLFPLSGAGFIVDGLPQAAQKYILWLPMVNGVEFVREGFFGASFHARHDMPYMAIFNLILTVAALSQVRKISGMVTPE